jgi:hypothetical protein
MTEIQTPAPARHDPAEDAFGPARGFLVAVLLSAPVWLVLLFGLVVLPRLTS